MKFAVCFAFFIGCLSSLQVTRAARILAVVPIPSYSHQISFQPLWKALSQRGHEVVLVTTDPIRDPTLTNLTEIDCGHLYKHFNSLNHFVAKYIGLTWIDALKMYFWKISDVIASEVLEQAEVKALYDRNSTRKFDLVIAEILAPPAFYGFAHRFKAPLIGIASMGGYTFTNFHYGGPVLPSHPSTWEMEKDTGINLPFWRRVKNFVIIWKLIYDFIHVFLEKQHSLAKRYFGEELPFLGDFERNMSLVFINQQPVLSYVKPLLPKVITFGSLHVGTKELPLPQDLKEFLDNARNGFVYVNFGTNAKGKHLPKEVQRIFLEVFADLPCRVLWKFEEDLPEKSDNVYTSKWFPQQSVLAHPNIRVFVYQGGLQSTEEAVHYAVPLVAVPILADQEYQVGRLVSLGVAKKLELRSISVENLNSSILEVLNDRRYKEKMNEVSRLVKDKPYNTLENMIWWVEHVIRHKGAWYLHSTLTDEPWYQRYDMDVIAFLGVVAFLVIVCASILISTILIIALKRCLRTWNVKQKIS